MSVNPVVGALVRAASKFFYAAPRRAPSTFLHPELIHALEDIGGSSLQRVPAVEIGHRRSGEFAAEFLQRALVDFEAEKPQCVLADESLDRRNPQALFLHVKQHIAAFAGAEKNR